LFALRLDYTATKEESFATRGWQAGVVLLATQTPSYFLLFILVHFVFFHGTRGVFFFLVVIAGTLALARVWEIDPRAVFGIVDGLGASTGGTLRRRIFVIRAGVSLTSGRVGGAGRGVRVCVLQESRRRLGGAGSRRATRRHGGGLGGVINVRIWGDMKL
jgi:hypothetical protein